MYTIFDGYVTTTTKMQKKSFNCKMLNKLFISIRAVKFNNTLITQNHNFKNQI